MVKADDQVELIAEVSKKKDDEGQDGCQQKPALVVKIDMDE